MDEWVVSHDGQYATNAWNDYPGYDTPCHAMTRYIKKRKKKIFGLDWMRHLRVGALKVKRRGKWEWGDWKGRWDIQRGWWWKGWWDGHGRNGEGGALLGRKYEAGKKIGRNILIGPTNYFTTPFTPPLKAAASNPTPALQKKTSPASHSCPRDPDPTFRARSPRSRLSRTTRRRRCPRGDRQAQRQWGRWCRSRRGRGFGRRMGFLWMTGGVFLW